MNSERDILIAYDNLAKSIVYQAIKDYKRIYRKVLKRKIHPNSGRVKELQRFFRSQWYRMLFDYDGERLMAFIEENCTKKRMNVFKIVDKL